jgi:type VI secretion system protein ImpF
VAVRTEIERTVRPSLLDRLTDDAPGDRAEAPTTREESARAYRASVLRDVEWLLNARRTAEPAPAALRQVRRSVYEYGLPDTLALPIATREGRERLVQWIEQTLAAFEPRLAEVRVALVGAEQAQAPQVRFAVSATLRMDPNPERVMFDTVFDVAAGGYEVRGADDGAKDVA